MKTRILLITLLFFHFLNAQTIAVQKSYTSKYPITPESLIYNGKHGELIPYKNFIELISNNPKQNIFVKEEDINGKPISYYIIMSNESNPDKIQRISFKRMDINDKVYTLENSQNKNTLIILQIDFNFPAIVVDDLKMAEDFALKKENFNCVILTYSDKNTAKYFAQAQGFNSIIIPEAGGIIRSLEYKRYPVFILADSDGSILEFTYYSYEVADLLNKY